ncbi:MAG: electron transfer flavoprotein subunit beta [Armatimonadota bacterium]|nr:electron transfer flavoprotein subunit beta [Armatimonadota bacterium]MDR7450487.1 electron transfer flavoprotein subunit beta [Armatimonadota bacterium]MDR7466379.1 electron transfer flavoprotein subunit beta [Armatimonadota bacterium]MDR7493101.1 electron transfer flavoprotein subunit beta [Armatimonadota bacterium]MDR7498142.1 electron transfer flavoprotein subunit beta [Armatimonadota bacterium]
MKIAVLLTMVPDPVEELEIDPSGTALDTQWLRYVLSESDDHALEQALLLKERHGAQVTALALDYGDVDQTLFTALAKGADEAVKIAPAPEGSVTRHEAAAIFAAILRRRPADLVLTGVQAINDLDGHLAGLLAGLLDLPYVGVTRSVEPAPDGTVLVQKEYPGGVAAEISVPLPAVIGVISAPQPPRYVPVARIREVMRTRSIGTEALPAIGAQPVPAIRRLYKPTAAGGATMLAGTPEEVARELVAVLVDRGVLR